MFDKMQYVLIVPEDIAKSSIVPSLSQIIPQFTRHFQIKDIDGNLIGSITETYGQKTIDTFEDNMGNKLGETRMDSKMGLWSGNLLIYDSKDQLRGKIKKGTGYHSNIFGWKKTTIPAHKLEDASGLIQAITDPFTFKTPIGVNECVFENLRKDGLNIRSPDGNIVATLKAYSSSDAIQIDLMSPNIDRLSMLSLIIALIC